MPPDRQLLKADCGACAGLCCVAPAFTASADFAIDKPAGTPCANLRTDFRCGIHSGLRDRGFPGCTVFDCFGAGQHVTGVTFSGQNWRSAPEIAPAMFGSFTVMRQLHESLWYLLEAEALTDGDLRSQLQDATARTRRLTEQGAEDLLALDIEGHRRDVGALLGAVSDHVRAGHNGPDRRGADLVGASLRGADLRGASLRGAYLIGADLRDADLTRADLLGADLRAADLRGARLSDSLFLTQPQLNAAKGDRATVLPNWAERPAHWSLSATSSPSPRTRTPTGKRAGGRKASHR